MNEVRVMVQESEKRSATWNGQQISSNNRYRVKRLGSYLSDPPDILVPIFLTKAQILVQPEPYIIPIQAVSGQSKM